MKIILSGTDSLGFMMAEGHELYDRCFLCHTTFIPYHEFEDVLGIKGIDEYIRYSGTMSISGNTYNMSTSFETKAKTNAYVDSAIAHNIQHSLKYYQYGTHFRSLGELYEKNELTNVINRVVEDIILLETQMARRNCEVFQLQIAIGEYDMVVFDAEKCCCEIYEIKHSTEVVTEQRRHLLDEKKLRDTAFRYGDIVGKYIIYRGEEMERVVLFVRII